MVTVLPGLQPSPLGQALGLGISGAVQGFMQQKEKMAQQKASRALGQQLGIPEDLLDAFSNATTEQQKIFADVYKSKQKSVGDDKQPLTLNESLNQLKNRHTLRVQQKTRPFEKRDAYGNIFLDFEMDEKNRDKVLKEIEALNNEYEKQVSGLYQRYNMDIPPDLLQSTGVPSAREIVTGIDDKLSSRIDTFSKANPPEKYIGRRAKTSDGIIIESDGKKWNLVK